MRILEKLRDLKYLLVFLAVSLVFFDLNYYFMTKLPGTADNMCIIGANLNLTNIIFSIFISVLSGLMIVGIWALFKMKQGMAGGSLVSGIGILLGTFTVFCTVCTIPVITLFGLSIGLTAFTTYNLTIKIVSIFLMIFGLYLLNKQLNQECNICKINKRL